jgi:peptidoglycan/LPS O-acetylase OafA/YrhL
VSLGLSILPYWVATPVRPFRVPFPDFTASEMAGTLFFLQCWVTQKVPVFGPSWTLAIEWWFYVLAPLFIRLPTAAIWGLIFVSLAFQKGALERGYFPVHEFEWGIPAMMLLWAWLSGFLFYRARGWSSVLLVLIGYYAMNRFNDLSHAAYLVAAFAVVMAKRLPSVPAVVARFLNYLGDLSYPLYLIHVPVLVWAGRWTTWHDPYAFVGACVAVSALLYHLVDAPVRARFSSRHRRKKQADARVPPRDAAAEQTA